MKKYIVLVFILAVTLAGCAQEPVQRSQDEDTSQINFGESESTNLANQEGDQLIKRNMYTQEPAMQIDSTKKYLATLRTDKGDIVIALFADAVPKTVNNFVFLSRERFYDKTLFHRTIKGFMIQGGDPLGNGLGGPGYQFADESFTGEYIRGTVAMANAGPNTNGSQFFIMHQDASLPKDYVIFGRVVSGMDVVDAIATAPVRRGATGEESAPVEPVYIQSVNIQEE